MKRLLTLLLAVGLATAAGVAPIWAGGPPNPTMSDATGDTAGGTNALFNLTTGVNHTAFGDGALQKDTTGQSNTALGTSALLNDTSGQGNTAVGSGALVA